jgi:hypothetical protein
MKVYHRNYVKTYKQDKDGLISDIKVFNPLIVWHIEKGMFTFGFRGHYEIGFYYGYTIGNWSRIKTKFIKIFNLTIFINYGECEPYNPITGLKW